MSTVYASPTRADGYKKKTQTVFGGLDHREGAKDGSIWHMENMSGDYYPLAAPRKGRRITRTLAKPNGIAGYDGIYYADGTGFYDNGERVGNVTDSKKQFAFLGKLLVILPDKAYYNTETKEFGSLEAVWSGTAAFADGTYMGEDAEGCRITTTGSAFSYRVGDAVTITGADDDENNVTIVIREISEDKKSLGFYEHSFTVASNQTLTISRYVPDMDFICQNENRLWGCKGDTIYSSKLGDPFNWNVFDGLATDSYSVTVGSAGDFTACTSYLGYAIFFKEDQVYKLYGDKPSNYQLMSSATLGVMKGAHRSIAIAGETLYYLSRVGVMAYTGGIPQNISAPLGNTVFADGVGGTDGRKYYISMRNTEDDTWSLYNYDTRVRAWYREDALQAVGFTWYDGMRMLASDGIMYRVGAMGDAESGETEEAAVTSLLEFGDIVEDSPDRKHSCKIQLRVSLEAGTQLRVYTSYDGKPYRLINQLRAPVKQSYYIPMPLARYDHCRIRLEGVGDWKLYSLTREYAQGSEL